MDTSAIEKNGKIYLLAYDQGMEHGPTDFVGNDINHDASEILKLAWKGNASCVTMHYGLARHLYGENTDFRKENPNIINKVPLILKLNGKSKLYSGNYIAALTANVEDAVRLGAVGVGFTIHPGQKNEHIAMQQFCEIRREAEKAGLFTTLWSYARGPEIEDQFDPKVVSYAVRVAAELGADITKVKYTGSAQTFTEAVKVAGKTKVVASGTDNFEGTYPEAVADMMKSGAVGVAVGRKVWQNENPVEFSKEVANAIYNS